VCSYNTYTPYWCTETIEREIPWYERVLTRYDRDLIYAVRWLVKRGVKRNREIARRLEVAPETVQNIRCALREKGMLPEPGSRGKREKERGGNTRDPRLEEEKGNAMKFTAIALQVAGGFVTGALIGYAIKKGCSYRRNRNN